MVALGHAVALLAGAANSCGTQYITSAFKRLVGQPGDFGAVVRLFRPGRMAACEAAAVWFEYKRLFASRPCPEIVDYLQFD